MGKVIFLFEKDKLPITKPPGAKISANDIVKAIKSKFNIRWWQFWYDWKIYIADPYYFPIDLSIIEKIKPTFDKQYTLNIFDCDDFSFLKKGYEEELGYRMHKNYAFGIIWVFSPTKFYGHALNFFIDANKKLWFYEPQNDSYFEEVRDNWKLILAVV